MPEKDTKSVSRGSKKTSTGTPKKVVLHDVVTFVKTAQQSGLYPSLTNVKAAGFIALMRNKDMYYVENEDDFVKELNKFINK